MKLVFDAGGTNLRVAVSSNGTTIIRKVTVPTPKRYEAGLRAITNAATELSQGRTIKSVAGGVAGPFNTKRSALVQSTHLPGWANQPLLRDLRRLFRVPVLLENDSALAALGEATAGAGKRFSIVGYINIGTGIGGARVVGGVLDQARFSFEPGHHLLSTSASRKPGVDWERFVSGSAVRRATGRSAHTVNDASVWKSLLPCIATGLANATMFWSPDVIVIGGSVTKRFSGADILAAYQRVLPIRELAVPIRRARFGDDAGLHGALALLTQHRSSGGR